MSLYPISTACPKCGAKPHTVCSNILSQACDERWIAAGAIDARDAATNPETAGVEPVAEMRERLRRIASLANAATTFHEEAMMRNHQTIVGLVSPAAREDEDAVDMVARIIDPFAWENRADFQAIIAGTHERMPADPPHRDMYLRSANRRVDTCVEDSRKMARAILAALYAHPAPASNTTSVGEVVERALTLVAESEPQDYVKLADFEDIRDTCRAALAAIRSASV